MSHEHLVLVKFTSDDYLSEVEAAADVERVISSGGCNQIHRKTVKTLNVNIYPETTSIAVLRRSL